MTKSFPLKLLNKPFSDLRLVLVGLVLMYGVVVLICVGLIVYQTRQVIRHISAGQIESAANQLLLIHRSAQLANTLTGHQIPDFRLANRVTQPHLSFLPAIYNLSRSLNQNKPPNLSGFVPFISALPSQTDSLINDLDQSWFVTRWLPTQQVAQFKQLLSQLSAASPALTKMLTSQAKILILMQNRNELRSSGGFMGSYLLITLDRGQVTDFSFEDIYDADGQFTGYVPAPPGVKEYLSSDKGLRLPDANWSAEFSQAGPIIMSYFSLGKRTNIDLLVAINQRPLIQLLTQTGPIPLPDYHTTLNADNLDQLLQDRGEFFPGSRAKTQMLTAAFIQLRNQVMSGKISSSQLAEIIRQGGAKKDVLFFAPDPSLQALFSGLNLTGEIKSSPHIPFLYLLESNVGINKINPMTDRSIVLKPESDHLNLTITWHNSSTQVLSNQSSSLKNNNNYINYQRIIVPASWTVDRVSINDQPVTQIDQNPIELSSGLKATQIGFLVAVPNLKQTTAVIDIQTEADLNQLQLVSQPGQQAYPVTIQTFDHTQTLVLDQDLVVSW